MKLNENIKIGDNEVTLKDLLKNREFMVINLNQEQKNTTTTIFKVAFNNVAITNSNKLSFYDNGIKIGKGISKVRVDLTLWLEQKSTSYVSYHIYKNNQEMTYNLNQNTGAVWSTGNSFSYITVSEGDVIYAYVRFADADNNLNRIAGFYANSCNLAVQVIE